MRPSSSTKQAKTNLIQQHRRNILVDTSSNISTHGDNSSGTSSLEQSKQHHSVPYQFSSTNLFNTYNILAAAAIGQSVFLNEEDSEDEEDSHDEDDEQPQQITEQQIITSLSSPPVSMINHKKQHLLTSRSLSPSVFYHKKQTQYEQETVKKSLHDSYQQGFNTKSSINQPDSTNTLDACTQISVNTVHTTSNPSTVHGIYKTTYYPCFCFSCSRKQQINIFFKTIS